MARTVTERSDVVPILAEVFREHGFEGASLSIITEMTGLGKGSLYYFFPGGKTEMARAVLVEIDDWFENQIYSPLRKNADSQTAIRMMCRAVTDYFKSGRRICLVGVFALDNVRDRFALQINNYFAAWIAALDQALQKIGHSAEIARSLAEEAIIGIQGALVIARALNDTSVFDRAMIRIEQQLISTKSYLI
jgi:TetR/AcrR family transcriptional regulator, lmrAB and yxaGH operons repressor